MKNVDVMKINQKQSSIGAIVKRCSEKIQQTYRRTHMPKIDFKRVTKQL